MTVDMSQFVVPKSDQLNADDLIGGPRTIRIARVSAAPESPEQPVSIHYEGDGGRPYKPCKSMRRVMIAVWGNDAGAYVGRSMTLFRDPAVAFGGMQVGGIRISHMSHLDEPRVMALTASKAQRKPYKVLPLAADEQLPVLTPSGQLVGVLPRAWVASVKKAVKNLPDAERVRAWHADMRPHIAAVRAGDDLMATEAETLIQQRLAELAATVEGEADA